MPAHICWKMHLGPQNSIFQMENEKQFVATGWYKSIIINDRQRNSEFIQGQKQLDQ